MADYIEAGATVGGQIAGLLPTHRQCSIQITNNCSNYTLYNPSVYMYSGYCAETFAPTTESFSTGSALFMKTANTACGAVGVFTYDLLNKCTQWSTKKIAVMFSVPYDFNVYSNWFAAGVFDRCKLCDYDLYNHMYNDPEDTFNRQRAGSIVKYTSDQVTILATMSDSYQPVMKIEVRENCI